MQLTASSLQSILGGSVPGVVVVELEVNMVLLTMIARVADGLPLAASMQEDEQVSGRTASLSFHSTQGLIFVLCEPLQAFEVQFERRRLRTYWECTPFNFV